MSSSWLNTLGGRLAKLRLSAPPTGEELTPVLAPSLLAYYPFQDQGVDVNHLSEAYLTPIVDYSGNHRDCTIHGKPTFLVYTPSSIASVSLNVPGVDYFTQSAGTPVNTSSFTLNLWFRGPVPAARRVIFGLYESGKADKIVTVDAGGGFSLFAHDATAGTLTQLSIPAASIDVTRWNMLTAYRRGDGTLGFGSNAFDGALGGYRATGTNTGTRTDFTVPNVRIGAWGDGTYAPVAGNIDEVALWGGGLTDTQVRLLYLGTSAQPAIPPALPAPYATNARVTRIQHEALVLGGTSHARVTRQQVEVLRSVAVPALTVASTQTLAFAETVHATLFPPITHTASLSQTLVFSEAARRAHAAADTQILSFTETVAARKVHPARDTLAFTETVTTQMVRSRALLQTLAMAQSNAVQATHNVAVSQTLAFVETAVCGHVRNRALLQALAFVETTAGLHTHYVARSPSQTLAFAETATITYGKHGAGNDTLLLVNQVRFQRTIVRHLAETLTFAETLGRPGLVRSRHLAETLAFLEVDYPVAPSVAIGGVPVLLSAPVAGIWKVAKTVVLRAKTGAVTLPVPEFSDTDTGNDSVAVKRTMTGIFYTYVRTSPFRSLAYEFVLGRRKALELRAFLVANLSVPITLTNWKGETFVGQVTNNPVAFNTAGRYAGAGEKVTVAINFEGVPLR